MTPKERAKRALSDVYGCRVPAGRIFECPHCIRAVTKEIAEAEAAERKECAKTLKTCIAPLMERCQEIPGGMVWVSVVAETLNKTLIAIRNPAAESDDGQSGEDANAKSLASLDAFKAAAIEHFPALRREDG